MQPFSKILLARIENPECVGTFSKEEAKAKAMRLCIGSSGKNEKGNRITLSLLIDEEDGVIADVKFQAFGPPSLIGAAECGCRLLVRKNYMQAKRLSADLIEKEADGFPKQAANHLNQVIDAIDEATISCMDIPIEDIYVTPPQMEGGDRTIYPNWKNLSDDEKKAVISHVMKEEIQPYIELDAGGVEVIKVEENRVTIAYSGNCTSCFSATGATLDAIGNILRHKIFPDLMVTPDSRFLDGSQGL